jgi:D-glycero-alpha-D-manno-heptose-7-phosphate kinase
MRKQLIKGNLDEFALLLNEERLNRQQLDRDISKGLTKFINVGMMNGAIAAKILGAGCGGTLLFYSAEKQMNNLKNHLKRIGGKIYSFEFDFDGVRAWTC